MESNIGASVGVDPGELLDTLALAGWLLSLVGDLRKLTVAFLIVVVGGIIIMKLASSRGNGAAALGTALLGAVLIGILAMMPGLAQKTADEIGDKDVSGDSSKTFNNLFKE